MKNFETFCSEEEEKLCKMVDKITAQIAKDKAQNKVQDKADYFLISNRLPVSYLPPLAAPPLFSLQIEVADIRTLHYSVGIFYLCFLPLHIHTHHPFTFY